jgi:LuxR family maltose regulon positive regulatory protein
MRLAVQKLDRVHPPQEAYCPPEHFGGPLGPMANLVVATKLHVPRLRSDIVHRRRLLDLLDHGAQSRLTLLSAPAGFGKTTLLVDWLATRKTARLGRAWVSLDQADNEAAAFWAHLIAGVRGAAGELGQDLPTILPPDQLPDRNTTVGLLNALAALDGEMQVILDDLHVIENTALYDELTFLIEHLPDNIHLVVSTRADPPLPLARLRARGELTEIRAADLRFRPEEAASYFADTAHLSLGAGEVEQLEQRTEGWIAALQLAALSMRGRSNVGEFVANFAGSDRYVVDYLVEEVLRDQPEEIRRFLFGTAVLSRFSAELCDAILGGSDSRATIDVLDQQNLFLVALDDRRQWYRYHQLFADVLQAHMPQSERDRLPERHRQASLWFEAHGDRDEAIRHALAAPDFELAAQLIERALPQMRQRRRIAVLRSSIEALPDALVRARPALSIGLVGPLLTAGVTQGVAERLDEAETQLRASGEAAWREFIGAIELYRSALAQMRGEIPAAMRHAQRVFELAPGDAYLERAGAAGFLAIVAWTQGDLDTAQRHWRDCTDGLLQVGYVADAIGTIYARGQISIAQGRLGEAREVLEHGLALAAERKGYPLPGSADLHLGLAEVDLCRGDLAAAHRHVTESESVDLAGMPQYPSRKLIVQARLACAESDFGEALTLLDEAARLHVGDFFPVVRPIPAMRAGVAIRQRDWPAVERWQRDSGVTADLSPSYAREYEQVTLARYLLALGDARAARLLLERLVPFAKRGGRQGVVAELALLLALAFDAMGDASAAQSSLRQALEVAGPEGRTQLFLDQGERCAKLLREAARGKPASIFARNLLTAFGTPQPTRPAEHPNLLEPLSDRELEVLRLLRSELSGPEIASELRVSLNTLRTHTKNIFEKLAVNSRRAAVRRAEDLNLLVSSRTR